MVPIKKKRGKKKKEELLFQSGEASPTGTNVGSVLGDSAPTKLKNRDGPAIYLDDIPINKLNQKTIWDRLNGSALLFFPFFLFFLPIFLVFFSFLFC
jgi:hypothetical protein